MNRVVVYIRGSMGLGNQMFCYAAGYSLAKKHNMKLYLDVSKIGTNATEGRYLELFNYDIKCDKRIQYPYKYNKLWNKLGFNAILRKLCTGIFVPVYLEDESMPYDENFFDNNRTVCIDGNWQNKWYCQEYQEDFQKMFIPKCKVSEGARRYVEKVKSCHSVSVHVRRGDYASMNWCLPMKYYDMAIETMAEKQPDSVFYIFSDDKAFVREYFDRLGEKYNIEIVDYEDNLNTTIEDMYIMSSCENNIIANSTYSWWAAFLNSNENALVLCPRYRKWSDEFYMDKWIKIDVTDQ